MMGLEEIKEEALGIFRTKGREEAMGSLISRSQGRFGTSVELQAVHIAVYGGASPISLIESFINNVEFQHAEEGE